MLLKFDWDQWNIQKNERKHGVSKLEAESLFFDNKFLIFEDLVHSKKNEKRWISYASSLNRRILMCAFTIRNNKIRIISCRPASKKEREIYEK
jgi:uncharacterized DUF497 family protein